MFVVLIFLLLRRLKQQEEAKARLNPEPTEIQVKTSAANAPQRRNVKHPAGLSSVHEDDEEDVDSRIAKLIEERDTLLHTGVYTTDDRIIVELDRQIRDAIASKDSWRKAWSEGGGRWIISWVTHWEGRDTLGAAPPGEIK